MLPGSALVLFETVGHGKYRNLRLTNGVFLIHARGDRENVRKALARACSHKRRLVLSRPSVYMVNTMVQLGNICGPESVDYLGPDPDLTTFEKYRPTVNWHYRIYASDRVPRIRFGEQEGDEFDRALFEFLGTEHKKTYEWTEARKKRRGGRPTGMRKRNPELFTNLKEKPVTKQQLLTAKASAAGSSKALGLKHTGRRIIPVDFSKMTGATGAYDQDAEFNEVWEDELSSDSQSVPGAI